MSLKYRVLNTVNPSYDPLYVEKLHLLYSGGKKLLQNASLFIARNSVENNTVYGDRLQWATYHNHMAEVHGDYSSTLFSKSVSVLPAPVDDPDDDSASHPKGDKDDKSDGYSPSGSPQSSAYSKPVEPNDPMDEVDPFYKEFSQDADLCETSFEQVLKQVADEAMLAKIAYLGFDLPKPKDLPPILLEKEMAEISMADEEKFNLTRVYIFPICYDAIIDWECDDFGRYKWCILKDTIITRTDPSLLRDIKTISFKIWKHVDGKVMYETYERKYPIDKDPEDEDEFELNTNKSGNTTFPCIPIKCISVPDSMWLGNQLFSMITENFRLRSMLNFAESRAANEIPFYQMASSFNKDGTFRDSHSDGKSPGSFKSDLVNKGFVVGDENDNFSFVGPKGEIFTVLQKQLMDNVNEIHRIHHLMASTIASKGTSQSQHKSGTSKQSDNEAMERNLQQYAIIIKRFATEIYEMIADIRGRGEEKIVWQCFGMDDFSIVDRADLLLEGQALNAIPIPSKTWKKHQLTDFAMKWTPELDPTTMMTVKREIDAAVDAMSDQAITQPDGYARDSQAQQDQSMLQVKQGSGSQNGSLQSSASKPASKMQGANSSPDPESSASDMLGETGHVKLDPSSHLQTGEHVDYQTVRNTISNDYKPGDLDWMKYASWRGPVEVDTNEIDMSQSDMWTASKPGADGQDKVNEFAEKIADTGQWKPIILTNTPHNDEKYQIIDGRHRLLAAKKLGVPVLAYIADVGSNDTDTDHMMMHSKQQDQDTGEKVKS